MPIYVSLIILLLVVVFMVLAFAFAVTLAGTALREREGEWPDNWRAPTEAVGPEGIVRGEGEETAAGAHRVA